WVCSCIPATTLDSRDESLTRFVQQSRLNALGIRPRDMIDILKAVHAAGALHAEFIVN
ncbi:flagellar basal body P-ring protein FlgI, partial [Paracoccus sp. AS002]|uniref:flagellar basal body P-ring protein FlgI n=1 Tax=Paracoccus sp. AS002 TaxID=3019545 RepID=UPI0023E8ED9C